jgi:hypothetical protein
MRIWITALADAGERLSEPGLASAELERAARNAKEASDKLAGEVSALAAPEAERGQEARAKVDEFAAALRGESLVIEQTLDSNLGLRPRAETIAIVISTAGRAGKALFDELRLNTGEELADAFQHSRECESLGTQMSDFEY